MAVWKGGVQVPSPKNRWSLNEPFPKTKPAKGVTNVKKEAKKKPKTAVDDLTAEEREAVTIVFHQFETGLREGTIFTKVSLAEKFIYTTYSWSVYFPFVFVLYLNPSFVPSYSLLPCSYSIIYQYHIPYKSFF